MSRYFNPRPPCGGRPEGASTKTQTFGEFQSTSPVRGTTPCSRPCRRWPQISIHVPRAGDDVTREKTTKLQLISIHVPRAGDDFQPTFLRSPGCNFNPRPPCGGRPRCGESPQTSCNFNPRPPCGGRQASSVGEVRVRNFNPRPPCGGRRDLTKIGEAMTGFQSTSPVRGTTRTCRPAAS